MRFTASPFPIEEAPPLSAFPEAELEEPLSAVLLFQLEQPAIITPAIAIDAIAVMSFLIFIIHFLLRICSLYCSDYFETVHLFRNLFSEISLAGCLCCSASCDIWLRFETFLFGSKFRFYYNRYFGFVKRICTIFLKLKTIVNPARYTNPGTLLL